MNNQDFVNSTVLYVFYCFNLRFILQLNVGINFVLSKFLI